MGWRGRFGQMFEGILMWAEVRLERLQRSECGNDWWGENLRLSSRPCFLFFWYCCSASASFHFAALATHWLCSEQRQSTLQKSKGCLRRVLPNQTRDRMNRRTALLRCFAESRLRLRLRLESELRSAISLDWLVSSR